jgi:hypothetical protein
MQALAQKMANDNGAPYQRALALETYLAEHYRLDPQAPSGHAYPNLDFFLFSPRRRGGQKGTSEQFAAAFAVLARLMNLPSRVVVGFQAHKDNRRVTAGDALAWPEVYFTAWGGWRSTRCPGPISSPSRRAGVQAQAGPSSEPAASRGADPTLEPTTAGAVADTDARAGDPQIVLIAGAGGGGLFLLTLLVFVLTRPDWTVAAAPPAARAGTAAQRSRAPGWRSPTPSRLAGRRPPAHLTAEEVAEHAASAAALIRGKHTVRLAAPPIDELADVGQPSHVRGRGIRRGAGRDRAGASLELHRRASSAAVVVAASDLDIAPGTAALAPPKENPR